MKQIRLLRKELEAYKDNLTQKVSWVVCNKIDLLSQEDVKNIKKEIQEHLSITENDIFMISAATGDGVNKLLNKLETEIFKKLT
jgi:GTP-binding protein